MGADQYTGGGYESEWEKDKRHAREKDGLKLELARAQFNADQLRLDVMAWEEGGPKAILQRLRGRLKEAEEQLAATKIHAEIGGLVDKMQPNDALYRRVSVTGGDSYWEYWRGRKTLEVGSLRECLEHGVRASIVMIQKPPQE